MSMPAVAPTWIGAWAIRAAMVFLGLFVIIIGMDLLGLGKVSNPFHNWGSFWQFVALGAGISLMLGLEFLIQHLGWVVEEPQKPNPTDLPMN